jgi:hypothetical protein
VHRFPFLASEIFNCELNKVNDLFFTYSEAKACEEESDHSARGSGQKGDNDQNEEEEDGEEETQQASPEQQDKHNNNEDEEDFERYNEEDDVMIQLGSDN